MQNNPEKVANGNYLRHYRDMVRLASSSLMGSRSSRILPLQSTSVNENKSIHDPAWLK